MDVLFLSVRTSLSRVLSVVKSDSWKERQDFYVKATKDFTLKVCPALSSVTIKFCRVITTSPRLLNATLLSLAPG